MISDYLKKYFKEKRVSQYDIANKTEISQSKINLSFNNKRKLTADELITIAIAYKLNLNKIKKEIIQSVNLK